MMHFDPKKGRLIDVYQRGDSLVYVYEVFEQGVDGIYCIEYLLIVSAAGEMLAPDFESIRYVFSNN